MALIPCLAALSPGSSLAVVNYGYIESLGWTIGNTETLKAEIPDSAAATEFLRVVKGDVDPPSTVGEYLFAQPFGTGETVFFATTDLSSRGFFAWVVFVRKIGNRLVSTKINSQSAINIESLAERLIDVDHDGVSEVLIPRPLATRSAARPTPFFVDIYSWNGTAYKVNNGKFKSYYRDVVLPEIESKLAQSKQKAGNDERGAAMQWKYQTEVDAINTFLETANNHKR
jgi:hypothetical protein